MVRQRGAAHEAKVAWSVITLPTAEGGLGLIDPAEQSRAMLGKLVVKGLLPSLEPWKELLLQSIHSTALPSGGWWAPNVRWIFLKMRRWAYKFATGLGALVS